MFTKKIRPANLRNGLLWIALSAAWGLFAFAGRVCAQSADAALQVRAFAGVAPAAVPVLNAVPGPAEGQVALSWTAPGVFQGGVPQAYQLHIQTFSVADIGGSAAAWWNSPAGFQAQGLYVEASGAAVNRVIGAGAPDHNLALVPSVTYYFAVRSADDLGFERNFWSAITTAAAVVSSLQHMPVPQNVRAAAASVSSLDFAWTLDTPAAEAPLAVLSADAAFSAVISSAARPAGSESAHYEGLSPNTTYWFKVKISTVPDFAYSAPVSTWTLAAGPAAASLGSPTTGSLLASWSAEGNPADTVYRLELSSSGFPAPAAFTASLSSTFGALLPNTAYSALVAAAYRGGGFSAAAPLGTRSTLALAPAPSSGPALLEVFQTSATFAWTARPAFPAEQSCSGYRLEAHSGAGYGAAFASTSTADVSLSTLTIQGLVPGVTFYFRVGSLNADGAPNWLILASTVSHSETHGGALVEASSETVVAVPVVSTAPAMAITEVRLEVPPAAFPDGTVVSVNVEPPSVPPPTSAENNLAAAGNGVEINAAGLQPAGIVRVRIRFDSLRLPPRGRNSRLSVGRYDPSGSRWQLLPTTIDAAAGVAVAETSHFSLFNLFVVAGAADALDDVKIYPIPWKPGSGDPRFDAGAVAFRNLTYPAKVTIYSLLGEKVWSGASDAAGELDWPGTNYAGRGAASGVYLSVIEGGSRKVTRRVVVIR